MASNTAQKVKGCDLQFVDPPPDDLFCLICLSVARDPQQVNCCGKVLCKTCLAKHKKYSKLCPQCKKDITSFADKRSERHILSLRVKCNNSPHGCEWIGELRSLGAHMTTCGFTLLPCPNECKDGQEKIVKLLRKDIEVHKKEVCPRRQYECPHCQESGEYQERTSTHLEECPKVKIPCPNDGCEEKIERRNIAQHREMCLFEVIDCTYSDIGCTEAFIRKDMDKHQNDSQQHLQLAIDKVKQHEDKLAQLQSQVGLMNFKVTGFDQLKKCSKTSYSPAFYTSPGGYKMRMSVDANGSNQGEGTHVSVFAYLMRGENDDHLPWPFTGTITVELLNQLKDDNHHSEIIIFRHNIDDVGQRVVNKERSSTGYGCPRYIPHSDLGYITAKDCQYLKDDCLYLRVMVDAKSTSKPWLVQDFQI